MRESIGSDTPEISAGIARLLMRLKEMSVLKGLIHNNEKGTHFA